MAQFIEKNPELEREIVAEVMAAVSKGINYVPPPSESEGDEKVTPDGALDVEEGILDLSEDEIGAAQPR